MAWSCWHSWYAIGCMRLVTQFGCAQRFQCIGGDLFEYSTLVSTKYHMQLSYSRKRRRSCSIVFSKVRVWNIFFTSNFFFFFSLFYFHIYFNVVSFTLPSTPLLFPFLLDCANFSFRFFNLILFFHHHRHASDGRGKKSKFLFGSFSHFRTVRCTKLN